MSDTFYVPRTDLAVALAKRLDPDPVFGDAAGLFLAAPRRTGKSTFLRRDLIPLLEDRGKTVIYVDLFDDRSVEPAELIVNALARAVEKHATLATKLWRSLPFSKVSVGGVAAELKSEGTRNATITDLLIEMADRTECDVVLIIDEAQDALNTHAGQDAMFALKAARDAMNQRENAPRLSLVFTGSNRDKLSDLVTKSDQPFYGGTVTEFPALGRDYINTLTETLNAQLSETKQILADDLEAAFQMLGHRPELLQQAIREYALSLTGDHRPLVERADALKAIRWTEHKTTYDGLSDLQKTVLKELAADGGNFSPFADATVAKLSKLLDRKVSTGDVQKAINALRDAHIVWHRARGLYAIEDRDMRDWFLHQMED